MNKRWRADEYGIWDPPLEGFVYWWKEWGFLVGIILFFVLLIGGVIYIAGLRYQQLESIGCQHTPVDWKNGSFYVTDDNWACPYQK